MHTHKQAHSPIVQNGQYREWKGNWNRKYYDRIVELLRVSKRDWGTRIDGVLAGRGNVLIRRCRRSHSLPEDEAVEVAKELSLLSKEEQAVGC